MTLFSQLTRFFSSSFRVTSDLQEKFCAPQQSTVQLDTHALGYHHFAFRGSPSFQFEQSTSLKEPSTSIELFFNKAHKLDLVG
mmetsp:Transcript_16070/g.19933  ORF Transcript_16070/g.19933 Transcript_16070/m.19933 type:complete len:83 (-) Transcript_16070:485-733(-)